MQDCPDGSSPCHEDSRPSRVRLPRRSCSRVQGLHPIGPQVSSQRTRRSPVVAEVQPARLRQLLPVVCYSMAVTKLPSITRSSAKPARSAGTRTHNANWLASTPNERRRHHDQRLDRLQRTTRPKLRFRFDILSDHNVTLKINGEQTGFCPLPGHPRHDGKKHSPSFSANLAKGIFQCFARSQGKRSRFRETKMYI